MASVLAAFDRLLQIMRLGGMSTPARIVAAVFVVLGALEVLSITVVLALSDGWKAAAVPMGFAPFTIVYVAISWYLVAAVDIGVRHAWRWLSAAGHFRAG